MRSLALIIGLISAMAFAVGWLFQILHYPGGSEISVYGFIGFSFLFIPIFSISDFRKFSALPAIHKLKFVLGFGGAILVGLSVVFKLFQVQGSPQLMMTGAFVFIVGFLPVYFFTLFKSGS